MAICHIRKALHCICELRLACKHAPAKRLIIVILQARSQDRSTYGVSSLANQDHPAVCPGAQGVLHQPLKKFPTA